MIGWTTIRFSKNRRTVEEPSTIRWRWLIDFWVWEHLCFSRLTSTWKAYLLKVNHLGFVILCHSRMGFQYEIQCGNDCFTNATTTVLLPIVSTAQVSVLVLAKEFGNGLSHDFACNCLYLMRNRLQDKLRHSKQDVVGVSGRLASRRWKNL